MARFRAMTQEDKQLLLVDLCGRLPYGVKAQYYGSEEEMLTVDTIEAIYTQPPVEIVIGQYGLEIEDIKPYLRHLSSMTEEEKVEYCDLQDKFLLSSQYPVTDGYALFDWLNAHHFDYRGLIERNLAIDCSNLNIYD